MAPKPPNAPRAPAQPWRASSSRCTHGGPRLAPKPPNAPRAPAQPWRASSSRCTHGGPRLAPKPPNAPRAGEQPWRASSSRCTHGGPRLAPNSPTLLAPRRSRGADRHRAAPTWGSTWPASPGAQRASAAGAPRGLSVTHLVRRELAGADAGLADGRDLFRGAGGHEAAFAGQGDEPVAGCDHLERVGRAAAVDAGHHAVALARFLDLLLGLDHRRLGLVEPGGAAERQRVESLVRHRLGGNRARDGKPPVHHRIALRPNLLVRVRSHRVLLSAARASGTLGPAYCT